jgi:hypothetical protein
MKWVVVERTLGKLALCAVLSAIIAPCATLLTGFLGDRGAPVPTFIGMLADQTAGLILAGYFSGSFVILAMVFKAFSQREGGSRTRQQATHPTVALTARGSAAMNFRLARSLVPGRG